MDEIANKVYRAKVVSSESIALGVVKITFKIDFTFSFLPWQYVWIEIPELKYPDPKGNRRAFTILNTKKDDDMIEIVVRKRESGYITTLCALIPGDEVRVHGPFGNSFIIDEKSRNNIIMIAGGVGIAAFLPMIKTVRDMRYPIKCFLVYLNRSPEVTPFLNELEEIKKHNDFFDYTVKYTNFAWSDVADAHNQFRSEAKWWITGPQDMVDYVYTELSSKGINRNEMVFENYYPTPKNDLTIEKVHNQITSDNLFAKAIQNSTNHTVITDVEGKVLFANHAAEKITGYTLSEMIGNTPRLWGGMMSRDFYVDFWKKKLSGEPFEGEIVNRRKNGDIYYAVAHIAPIFGNEKEIVGYIGTEEDITEMKMQEKKVQKSEQLLSSALEGNRDGLWDWNIVTEEVYFSPRWKAMLGFNDDEIQGSVTEWEKRVHPDDLSEVEKVLQDHLDGKTPFYESEHRVLCKDGTYKWILDRGKVTERDSQGKALHATGTHTDISERKEIEQKLSDITNRFTLATQSARIGVWEWDVQTNRLVWDDRMYELYGVNRTDFSGAYDAWQKGLHPDDKQSAEEELQRAIKGEKEFDTSFRIILPNGEVRHLKAYAQVVRDKSGNALKIDGLNWDITHEKEVDRMKTEFISLASHQLRTPLSAMKWFGEMLVKGDAGALNPEQKAYAENILASNKRMIELVNDLLNISRIESGRIIIDPELVRLQDVIDEVINETKIKTNARKQHVVLNIQSDLPEVSLDKKLIREVYANLITNASKYTPDEGEIRISVSIKGDDLVSIVGDTGYGIEEKDKEKIFSKFFRGQKTSKLDTDGNGLGLYLVKAIVDSSGGKIWFESHEGTGTTFTFTVPIKGMTKKDGEVSLA